ncbi:MAG: chorismate mutase family protein [Rhodococcus sp.]|nr:chorismate mutase family protein [Rhodococcus sp. (in: high G+C Gram-positive bacteria)]
MYFSVEDPNDEGGRNGSTAPTSPAESALQKLEFLRAELDEIDSALMETVRARLEVCLRIGHLKQEADIPVVQPARMGLVHERARDFANAHGLSPDFFNTLYTILIAETCRLEEQIINADFASDPE